MGEPFSDRLIQAARTHGPLCVGVDPHAGRIPLCFGGDTPDGVRAWGLALVEAVRGRCGVVKPQVALFERHGPAGMAALQAVCATARAAGLLVITDAKRGDIGSTAEGYAEAYLGVDAPFPSDAVTVNPYMGVETLEPFVRRAEAQGKGVVVLARTSNPGAADFQGRNVDGAPLFTRVVEALEPYIERLEGAHGWSSLMLVAGATGPAEARRLRSIALNALFLVPGYGAQGADAAQALASFLPGPFGLEGGVVNASRSIAYPRGAEHASSLDAWRALVVDAIEAAQSDLSAAAGR
ncbi:MAG: orotidine-5'-phosphate decarboxylase [Pseudomonadota bacterium]